MEIKVEKLSYRYSDSNEEVFHEITNEFKEKITFLTGVNGSGKTTFLNLLNLLDAQTGGIIQFGTEKTTPKTKYKNRYKLRKHVNMVNQFSDKQIFNLTVKEELLFNNARNKEQLEIEIKKYFKRFDIDIDLLSQIPFNLSGGQKRKIAIITMLLLKPKLLLLDEPTIGLDVESKNKIMQELERYAQKDGNKIIIISHSSDDIYTYADAVVEFKGKKVVKKTAEEYFYEAYEAKDKNKLPSHLKVLLKYDISKERLTQLNTKKKVLTFIKEER